MPGVDIAVDIKVVVVETAYGVIVETHHIAVDRYLLLREFVGSSGQTNIYSR